MPLLGGLSAALDRGRALVDDARHLAEAKLAEARQLAESARDAAREASSRRELITFHGYPVLMNGSTMAEGGFAFVHIARHAETGKPFAVKRMLAQDRDSAELARAERKLLSELPPHPNIVRMFASTARRAGRFEEHLLLLEYCSRGTLIRYCTPGPGGALPPPLDITNLLEAFVGVCRGVSHLHSQSPPIAHRDLKLENVLVDDSGTCKICDFGSATTRTLNCATASRQERLDEEDIIARFTTAMNRAPEMLDLHRGHRIDAKVDVWALGNLLFALAFQVHPFNADPPNLQILNGNWRVPPGAKHAAVITPLVEMMLMQDPAQRPDVFAVTQAASLLHAEAAAAQSMPYESQTSTRTTGSARPLAQPQGGRAGLSGRAHQQEGGSAFRFEDMMRDMDAMSPAASPAHEDPAPPAAMFELPAWTADFSAFDAGESAGISERLSAGFPEAGTGDGDGDSTVASDSGATGACGWTGGGGGSTDPEAQLFESLSQLAPQPVGTAVGPSDTSPLELLGEALLSGGGHAPVPVPLSSSPLTDSSTAADAPVAPNICAGEGATYSAGERVMLVGLQARPELNGTTGTVLGPAAAVGRFKVECTSGIVALKPANMQRLSAF